MRSEREAAEYMLQRYGDDADIHCNYAIMNNIDNETARQFWNAVLRIIYDMKHANRRIYH